jgi:hypothetical protein
MTSFFAPVFAGVLIALSSQPLCQATSSSPALDHVVLVVKDLAATSRAFERAGFRIKPGRLHPNNLLNRHVKFRDGSEIELMTVSGGPGDAMAEEYASLLRGGEGGVYVALSGADLARVERAAAGHAMQTERSSSGPWQFLSFPSTSPAAAIFFSAGGSGVKDAEALVSHVPAVSGLAEAWIEGNEATGRLLASLGAGRCGPVRSKSGQAGERWVLGRGSIVVVPGASSARPRVLGVVLRGLAPTDRTIRRLPGFWIEYQQ